MLGRMKGRFEKRYQGKFGRKLEERRFERRPKGRRQKGRLETRKGREREKKTRSSSKISFTKSTAFLMSWTLKGRTSAGLLMTLWTEHIAVPLRHRP